MVSILRQPSPLVALDSFRRIASKRIRTLPKDLFSTAILNLQGLGLGHIIEASVTSKIRTSSLFVKMPPDEVKDALQVCNLCRFDEYVAKYNRPLPSCLKQLQYLLPVQQQNMDAIPEQEIFNLGDGKFEM